MASESIAHSAFGLMGFDSGPIRARGIIVKYCWNDLQLTSCEGDTLKESEDVAPESREILHTFVW